MVSEKKIFLSVSHYMSMEANDPQGVASLGPREMVGRIYVGDHQTLLHTKYISHEPLRIIFKSMGAIYGHGGHLD